MKLLNTIQIVFLSSCIFNSTIFAEETSSEQEENAAEITSDSQINKDPFNSLIWLEAWGAFWFPNTGPEYDFFRLEYKLEPALVYGLGVGFRYGKTNVSLNLLLDKFEEAFVENDESRSEAEKRGRINQFQKYFGSYISRQLGEDSLISNYFFYGKFVGSAEYIPLDSTTGKYEGPIGVEKFSTEWVEEDLVYSRHGIGGGIRYTRFRLPVVVYITPPGMADPTMAVKDTATLQTLGIVFGTYSKDFILLTPEDQIPYIWQKRVADKYLNARHWYIGADAHLYMGWSTADTEKFDQLSNIFAFGELELGLIYKNDRLLIYPGFRVRSGGQTATNEWSASEDENRLETITGGVQLGPFLMIGCAF